MRTRDRSVLAPAWDAVVAFAATVAVLVVPVTLFPGFDYVLTARSPVEWGLTVIFAADVVVQARRRRHLRRGADALGTLFDVLAALPTVALGLPVGAEVLRLLKLYRVAGLMRAYSRRHGVRAPALRLVYFVYWIVVVLHLIACGFVQIGGVEPAATTDIARYVYALYWSVTTLTTVGYGDVAIDTTLLRLYAIGVMIAGVGAYAFLIGNIASLLSALDPLRAAHDAQRERVAAFLRYRRLPPELQARVHAYLDLAWDEGFAVDEARALKGLPPALREAVALHLRRDLLRGVPLFADASEAFVREVALRMRPLVCLPGDVIVHAGDHGHELFVLARGCVEVLDGAGRQLRTLGAGDFFGEIALFHNAVRTATVRAIAPSDLYVLDRALFERVLRDFPAVTEALRSVATARNTEPPAPAGGDGQEGEESA